MQRRSLHSDKRGGARNISTEAIDLREKIFAFENFARLAQGKRDHKIASPPIVPRRALAEIGWQQIGGDRLSRIVRRKDQQAFYNVSQLTHICASIAKHY